MTKGSFRIIAFIPVFVMYYGFPLIRDVLPYYQGYRLDDWLALGGLYALATLIATPLLFLMVKSASGDFKPRFKIPVSMLIAATIQVTCLFFLWEDSIPLYVSMGIAMGLSSVLYAYSTRGVNLIVDKDTGNIYRVHKGKAYRLSDSEVERCKNDTSGRFKPTGEFSSGSVSGFDSHSSVIPVSFGLSSNANHDYNSGIIVNPSTGMPMIGGMSGLDIHGNSWGTNFNEPSNTYDPNRGY
ncbi:hypothetical protein [Lelliottia nimipressuralis]|uniref:Uncharacterized protein n=1 Tax=Lelliottia nimipressuralis TaxID=69220 RepID=A0ABD4KII7_9ENTR|nr:hypothetical protein [Lelliottia nimipressuralis]MBF4180627.1 hypothetical protein [Lelliottia nimipressuralis]